MARYRPIQTNFASGELSPKLAGHVDLAKYFSGGSCVYNYLVMPLGGVTRRPGFRYVGEVKTSSTKVRLVRFEVSATIAYVLEFGDLYIRFYKNNARINDSAGAAVEITTTYAAADLFGLDFVPSVDVLYILHTSYQMRRLERYSDTIWKLRLVSFTPPPTLEFGARPEGDVVPASAASQSGENATIEARNFDSFYAADVGREILVTGGANAGARAGIKSVTNAKEVIANVCVAWTNLTASCSKLWKITGSPLTGVTPSAASPVGKTVTLTLDAAGWRGVGGRADSDCGRLADINNGSFEITKVTSTTEASAVIRGEAKNATKAESGNWTLEEAMFSSCNGWAETGTFHDSRFYLAAKHRFAGSKSGDYENFGTGNLDDDAVIFALDSEILQTIRWMYGRRTLLIGTISSEWQAIGGTEAPITATNIQVKNETGHGSSAVPPLAVGNATLFLTRSSRELRELVFNVETDAYVAPDLMLLADHLTTRLTETGANPTIVDLAYQREPGSRIWAVRSDGMLLCCTYLRDQNIVAWSRCETSGSVESVAVIRHPDGDRDQVWVLVNRTINGATKRYVEYLDDAGLSYGQLNTDAAWTCNSSVNVKTVTGLGHLEARSVQAVVDGAVLPLATVTDGNLTLATCGKKIEIGLGYTSDLITMRPEIPIPAQSAQGAAQSWASITVRLLNTLGMTLGTTAATQIVPFRKAGDKMSQAPALFTGDKRIAHTAWDDGKVIVRQTQPLPSTVLAITGLLDIGEG